MMRTSRTPGISDEPVDAGQRVAVRSTLDLPVTIHTATGECSEAVMTDLTTRGCRLRSCTHLNNGTHVTVFVKTLLIGGSVTWSKDGTAGIEFGARLLPRMLAMAIAGSNER